MFNYSVETIENNEKNIYEFKTDYIKAIMFLSQCKINGIEAKIISEFIRF
jgi:hypothetical protein